MDAMQAAVDAACRDFHSRLEDACERSLVAGTGVLVDRSVLPWSVEVSIAVPYGEVHYLP